MTVETRPLLLGGEWRQTTATQELRSPYDARPLGRFSVAGAAEVEEAIAAADRAARELRSLPRYEVADCLRALAAGVAARAEEFARTIALEAGKPIKTAA
jgi:acyl-CoA reductase-like NAD-dependent aldehyde dehydrogenase